MVGDSQIGKTSLMVKYVEGSFDEDYIQTLGVNFMEKTITVRRTTITFSIWDLGGQREVRFSLLFMLRNKLPTSHFIFACVWSVMSRHATVCQHAPACLQ